MDCHGNACKSIKCAIHTAKQALVTERERGKLNPQMSYAGMADILLEQAILVEFVMGFVMGFNLK